MCVLYVSFRCKVRPITVVCVAIGSAVLFIFRSRLLLYSVGSAVNRVQVVLSRFSVRLFCFVQAKTLCRYGCIYFLAALVFGCLVKQFAICFGVVAILLLNIIAVWVEVPCWIDRVWSSKECACCACDPSVHLSIHSIVFLNVLVCRKLSPHLGV